ncbi:IS5 family transposase [Aquimarina sp. RZ0]|uniref:IS5 family transposase n=1 Tax=Aquimarina sp. RZ0 TaxID=2607730 RepID=UPI0011F32354|nr:IS5 family transposase [Aquimarina sp. RZ0]KAA1245168.1 IS5 family transposase [Aquimarina sp. RZ0]
MSIAKRYKRHRDYGFFDQDIRLNKLSELGDPLERLKNGVDFEFFRALLEDRLTKKAKGKGGRPPYDYVLMFKILILQRYYNLSDDQAEYQINDRMSFMRFLDLTISDDIPDSKTIWHFNERITDLDLVPELFDLFSIELDRLGLVVNEGKIIDPSFVEAPRQRNSKDKNDQIKQGNGSDLWNDKPAKKRQKDIDARWTKKNNQNYYGYKNHAKIDSKSTLIESYTVTSACVHDSQTVDILLSKDDQGQELYADSAYIGQEKSIKKYKVTDQIHEKGYKNNPLTEAQKSSNTEKSRTRVRVEHVFGFMENSMGSMFFRKIGVKRAETTIGLMNLTYNMFRKIQFKEQMMRACL